MRKLISLFLFVGLIIGLYWNVFEAGYVWDDRAAIANNADIFSSSRNLQQIQQIFQHDFWGQNITDEYSHKSYRPITTISYRLNYFISGMNPSGFHVGNVCIYVVCCWLYFLLLQRIVSFQSCFIGTLLFCIHPVHVESVASLVGRADCLCGVFYLSALIFYFDSIGFSLLNTKSSSISTSTRTYFEFLYLFLAYFFGFLASFTKEVGLTVFGIFFVLEFLSFHFQFTLTHLQLHNKHERIHFTYSTWFLSQNQLISFHSTSIPNYFQSVFSFFSSSITSSFKLCLKILFTFIGLFSILFQRYLLHGNHQMYVWTVMENCISLEPSFLTRLLSYGHTHFLYSLKLFNPITPHLSFDYGYPCLPIIHSILQPINLFTFLTYFISFSFILYSLLRSRISLLFSFILLLFPLLPALNILFPVGTLLAERLLFIPSCGACLLFAELYTVEFKWIWSCSQISDSLVELQSKSHHSSTSSGKFKFKLKSLKPYFLLLFPLLPLFVVMSYRVRERNFDWTNEMTLFESSLKVCPDNVRALNNVGMLKTNFGSAEESIILLERARELYPEQASTYINSGVHYGRANQYIKAFYRFCQGLRLTRADSARSLIGYLGQFHYQYFFHLYSETLKPEPVENLVVLLLNSRYYLKIAIQHAWNTPIAYLTLANIEAELYNFQLNGLLPSFIPVNYDLSEEYLLTAIQLNDHLIQLSKNGIPVQDTIDSYAAYNQLGVYYISKVDSLSEAIQSSNQLTTGINQTETLTLLQTYVEKTEYLLNLCITLQPKRYEGRMNLGTYLQRRNRNEEALKVFQEVIDLFPTKESVPFIVWNNLGTVQEKVQQFKEAKESYQNALNVLESKNAKDHPSYPTVFANWNKLKHF